LALKPPAATGDPSSATIIKGRTFALQPNEKKMQEITFDLKDNSCHVTIKGDTAVYKLSFGKGKWAIGETTRPGPNLLTGAIDHLVGLPACKTAGSYDWKDDYTLELVLRYIESPHTETMTCHFDGNDISIEVQNSFEYGHKKTILKGALKE
jgi:hypothetical protein